MSRIRCFSARAIRYQAINPTIPTAPRINVARALISGFTPIRTLEKTSIGNVVAPGPETKLAITRSSSDKVKASNQPEMIAVSYTHLTLPTILLV